MENIFLPIEKDYQDSLEFIPFIVRFKLDKLQIKISLRGWQSLSLDQREKLFSHPFKTNQEQKEFLTTCKKFLDKSQLPTIRLNKDLAEELEEDNLLLSFSKGLKKKLAENNIQIKSWDDFLPLEKYAIKKWAYSNKFDKLNNYLSKYLN